MKRKSVKLISIFTIFTILIVTLIYGYISKGEVLKSEQISFLKKNPIAHRGLFDKDHPENSIAAFKNAIDYGYPIELDVQLTKDKKIVVYHDENLKRLTGYDKRICETNYKEIQRLKILDSNEHIPLLSEVLKCVDSRVPLLIEIKNCDEIIDLGKSVYNLTKNYDGKYAIQSFNPYVLEWYKNNASEVVRGQLSGTFKKDTGGLKWYERFALENMMLNYKSKPNFISYELEGLPHFRISSLRKKGIAILSWTIEGQSQIKKANKYSDNIIFDGFIPELIK